MKTQSARYIEYLEYFKRVIAEQVHLRGIENFDDFDESDKERLFSVFRGLLSSMINEERPSLYDKNNVGGLI